MYGSAQNPTQSNLRGRSTVLVSRGDACMDITLKGRVPIVALDDIERFLESAQHLKALAVQLHALRCRDSRRQAVLELQINAFTQHCGALVHASPRLAELWTQTQNELSTLIAPPSPVPGGSPVSGTTPPGLPAARHAPAPGAVRSRVECSPGARASTTNGKPAN